MRLLVVHAHPVPASFNRALFDLTRETLAAHGHEVEGLDLYGAGFDPVLDAQARRRYHDHGANALPVAAELERLKRCQGLVFVYPTWWYAQPAMLKGWLDRVLLPHVCFTMPTENRPVGPLLQHIQVLGGISTYGAPWWFTRWVGDPGRRILMRGIKPLMHPRCRTFWCALHRMDSVSAAEREAFKAQVRRTLARLPVEVDEVPVRMGDQALWSAD
jgi:putative NADPH-quinone reductase